MSQVGRIVSTLLFVLALLSPHVAHAGKVGDWLKSAWNKLWNKPPSGSTVTPTRVPSPGRKLWRLRFFDDFKGKPSSSANDNFCYDQVRPQCHIWAGGNSFNCDMSHLSPTDASHIPPLRENLAAAIQTLDGSRNWSAADLATVKNRYAQLVTENLRHLNKCVWTLYQMLNWMGTDYSGNYSSRFDPLMVRIFPEGKGYLELSAVRAPTTGAGACKDNIVYSPSLKFNNLSCNILNGGLMSMHFNPVQAPGAPVLPRGFSQKFGRFEAKMRIVKGAGAFPAAWLMPVKGGWPYSGGEIDVMEARDNGDEVYQTYHHGKCYRTSGADTLEAITYWDAEGRAALIEPNVCGGASAFCVKDYRTKSGTVATNPSRQCAGTPHELKGFQSMNISVGHTEKEPDARRDPGAFRKRNHVFAVEWFDNRIDYLINNARTHTVQVGTQPTANYATGGGAASLPAGLNNFQKNNFPVEAFYWILNHSTWVKPEARAGFESQRIYIDYVKAYSECTTGAELCPCGGTYQEGVGCLLGRSNLQCPSGESAPAIVPTPEGQRIYASPCREVKIECPNGGSPAGPNCGVFPFTQGEVRKGVRYWVDADPRWPGVYYKQKRGKCRYGGVPSAGSRNCQVVALPPDVLEPGVSYWVDTDPRWPGVYYKPGFRQ